MRLFFASIIMFFASTLTCNAQTYRWTDSEGVVHFSDALESVPKKYRKKMITTPDITIRNPKVREEMELQEQLATQEKASRPQTAPSPPAPAETSSPPPAASTPTKSNTEEPPPRTKSQKIRDNLERRRLEEEKAQQSGQY